MRWEYYIVSFGAFTRAFCELKIHIMERGILSHVAKARNSSFRWIKCPMQRCGFALGSSAGTVKCWTMRHNITVSRCRIHTAKHSRAARESIILWLQLVSVGFWIRLNSHFEFLPLELWHWIHTSPHSF